MSQESQARSSATAPSASAKLGPAGRLASLFINSKLTPLIVLIALGLGALAVALTPREEEPQIAVPMVDIFIGMPGGSPEEIESRITVPLERRLWQIPGVEYLYSTSMPGAAMVTVRFRVGEESEQSLIKVYDRLASGMDQTPPGATLPLVKARSIDDVPILALTLSSANYDSYQLRRMAGELRNQLAALDDIAEVTIIGGSRRALRVELDPQAMATAKLDPVGLADLLRAQNLSSTAGSFSNDDREIIVESGALLRTPEEFEALVVGVHEQKPIYLHQVARIVDGPDEATDIVLKRNAAGHPGGASAFEQAVTLQVAKRKGSDAYRVSEAALEAVKELQSSLLPSDVSVAITRNYGETANEKASELLQHLTLAILSVSILIGLALGWRGALVVFISVPVSFALTLFVYYVFGYTLNRVTLFALIFVTGIVVDDSIIVVENIVRHLARHRRTEGKAGLAALQAAAIAAVNEVGNPTILATLTVIASVLPMAFVRGLMGPYMEPMPTGASFAMGFSLFVALIVAPWFAFRLLRPRIQPTIAGDGKRSTVARDAAADHYTPADRDGATEDAKRAGNDAAADLDRATDDANKIRYDAAADDERVTDHAKKAGDDAAAGHERAAKHDATANHDRSTGDANKAVYDSVGKPDMEHDHDTVDKSSRTYRWYAWMLVPLLQRPKRAWAMLGIVGLALLASIALVPLGLVNVKMLPFDNKSEFQVIIDMPEGTTLERTASVARELSDVLAQAPEVTDIELYAGTAAPIGFSGLVRHYDLRRGANVADLQINLKHKSQRTSQSHAIAKGTRQALQAIAAQHDAAIKIVEVPPGPPVLATLVAEIYGPDAEQRRATAEQVKAIFQSSEGVVDIDWTIEAPQQKWLFEVDRDKAGLAGIQPAHVVRTMRLALDGETTGLLHVDAAEESIPIKVRLPRADRSGSADLNAIRIMSPGGASLPVSELTDMQRKTRQPSRFRKNLKPVVYVMGDVAGQSESPVYAILDMREKLDEVGIEQHFRDEPHNTETAAIKWDGEWHITYEVFRDLGAAFGLVLLLIYFLLIGWFGSFRTPLVMMVAIPLGLVGVLPGHFLFGAFFTATSMIGFIALAGIMVRNSVLLIDFVHQAQAQGASLADAVVAAGAIRLRPILLTAGTVVVGAVVILFDPIFQGLAIALMFGALASTALTLLVVPVLHFLVERRSE